jgi:DNA-binding IclR family transcriptional regulator
MAGGSTQWRGRSVISKVVSLLDAFTVDQPELSLGDLSRITGLPVSTTYRLASELVGWGGLERAESGTGYRIGMRLWELGALAPRGATLRELAQPFMQDLFAATGENVHLAVLDGQQALYVDTVSGRNAVPVRSRRGGRLPLHATGVGKVLLAAAPEDVAEAVLRTPTRETRHTIVDPGRLRREIAEVRRRGYARTAEEMSLGTLSVAVPVRVERPAGPAVVAALGVVVPSHRRDLLRLVPVLEVAARGIGRELARAQPFH